MKTQMHSKSDPDALLVPRPAPRRRSSRKAGGPRQGMPPGPETGRPLPAAGTRRGDRDRVVPPGDRGLSKEPEEKQGGSRSQEASANSRQPGQTVPAHVGQGGAAARSFPSPAPAPPRSSQPVRCRPRADQVSVHGSRLWRQRLRGHLGPSVCTGSPCAGRPRDVPASLSACGRAGRAARLLQGRVWVLCGASKAIHKDWATCKDAGSFRLLQSKVSKREQLGSKE